MARAPLVLALTLAASLLPYPAGASPELDRKYALQTIGFLRAWDNVDGLFADYVAAAYRDYFSRQSRFVLQDPSKADPAMTGSKLPYQKVINDPEILGQLARTARSESLIRTRIQKEGPQYRFAIDWLHSPKMEVMASETFVLSEPAGGKAFGADELRKSLHSALDRMIAKVPFAGHVTGRDESSVTVNLGSSRLKAGDTLVVGTLDEVKRHPLLQQIVDWRLSQTGRVEVEQVEESIAFAKVLEEEPGRQIGRYQKIVQILPKPMPTATPAPEGRKQDAATPEELPTLGYVSAGPWLGSFSREYAAPAAANGRLGGGFLMGAKAEAQVWLSRAWFIDGGYGYGVWSHTQKKLSDSTDTGAAAVSSNTQSLDAAVGYSYLAASDFFGPKGWVRLGYRSTSYSIPVTPAGDPDEFRGPVAFTSFFLGLGGDLPIRGGFGTHLNVSFGVFPQAVETDFTSGTASGASEAVFYLGGYYRLSSKLLVRAGVDVINHSATFLGTGNTTTNLTHRVVSFCPALVYYF
jgi:hypothetical protein